MVRTTFTALAATLALPAAAQDTTLTISTHYNQEQMAPLTACFEAYEAETGVAVEVQQASYRDYLQTILTARVGGTSPDIYNIYSIWAPQLVSSGTLMEPPEEIKTFVREGYGEGTVGAATVDGTLYGIPTELSVYQLVYNKKLLEEAGYSEPPATFEDLKEMASEITQTNDQGNITVAGYAYGPTEANAVHPFYAQLYAEGTAPFSDDLRESNLTDPKAVEILQEQAALFEDGVTSTAVETDDFASGGAAMAIMANWNRSTFEDAFGDAFEETVGVAPIPNGEGAEGGTMLYSFFWAVDATSENAEAAWDLLRHINEPRDGGLSCTGQMMSDLGALTGNLSDLQAMETDDFFTAPFVEAVETGAAVSQPNVWQAAETERVLRSYIEQVWAGRMDAERALGAADAEIQAILDEQP